MAECKYRTDNDGNLCTYNAHPKAVQCMYELKLLVSEIPVQHDELDELIDAIEYELFIDSGIGFAHWIRKSKLKKEISKLEDIKIHSWDTCDTIKLKKQIKKMLYSLVK